MKVLVLFPLLLVAFNVAESQNKVDDKIVCVERGDALKLVYGRDGAPGPPGGKGDYGSKGGPGLPAMKGEAGLPGTDGETGAVGEEGEPGPYGNEGEPGEDGPRGQPGEKGESGLIGESGMWGDPGYDGKKGSKGTTGDQGETGANIEKDMEVYILNNYHVVQSGYYNKLYSVSSRDLTDGRTDTGGWGSEAAVNGSYIQATFTRPVYVTSINVAGGFIPSWNHDVRPAYGKLDLEYSYTGKVWFQIKTLQPPFAKTMIFYNLPRPITAQYWRLRSAEDKWVGTTEFALNPLIKP